MKTAMQELIVWIDNQDSLFQFDKMVISDKANELLEKEKEQIIEAHGSKGWAKKNEDGSLTTGYLTGEQYYNKTFNQNK